MWAGSAIAKNKIFLLERVFRNNLILALNLSEASSRSLIITAAERPLTEVSQTDSRTTGDASRRKTAGGLSSI